MARTYREIAIQEMLRTVEEAMSQAIDWWGDLPPPMKEAIEQFRTQLGAFFVAELVEKRLLLRDAEASQGRVRRRVPPPSDTRPRWYESPYASPRPSVVLTCRSANSGDEVIE